MVRAHPLIAAACLALAATAAAVAGPSPMTDRSDILGWEGVGRIDAYGAGTCTGALIAPDLVLTAAHCVVDGETGERRDLGGYVFHAGYRDGETIASSPVARAVVPEAYDPLTEDFGAFLRNDVALLELAEPIPATTASPYAVSGDGREGDAVTVVSFGRSRMYAASRQSGCRISAAWRGLMVFDCNGEPGSSGAPIFDMGGRAPRIVSMISSGGPYEGRPSVYGAALPETVADLRAALRSGRGVWPERAAPAARRMTAGSARTRGGAGGALFLRP